MILSRIIDDLTHGVCVLFSAYELDSTGGPSGLRGILESAAGRAMVDEFSSIQESPCPSELTPDDIRDGLVVPVLLNIVSILRGGECRNEALIEEVSRSLDDALAGEISRWELGDPDPESLKSAKRTIVEVCLVRLTKLHVIESAEGQVHFDKEARESLLGTTLV